VQLDPNARSNESRVPKLIGDEIVELLVESRDVR